MNTPELERLQTFRYQLYQRMGKRRDALFEIMDAVLSAPVIEHPAFLSMAPQFQRTWGSVYDALNQGTLAAQQWEELLSTYPLKTTTQWYAIDGSVWPRCDAETSPERGYYHHPYRHSNGQPIVAGWLYSWLVQIPERCSSWTAPMQVRRVIPGENSNQVAIEQIRSHQRHHKERAIYTMDAGYDPIQLALGLEDLREEVRLLLRLRSGRCFYADPPSTPTGGRPKRHGAKCVCAKPDTWPEPTKRWSELDAYYGLVQVRAWEGLHAILGTHGRHSTPQAKPIVKGWLIRLEVECLPRPTKEPVPLWLWWWGKEPPNLQEVWKVSASRFSIEHTFRFFKQVLKWTTPTLRSPLAADRWTWLLIGAYVQLRLAQPLIAEHRLPWHRPLPPNKLTPARVRRTFCELLPLLNPLVNLPKPCGRSPGRPLGRRSPPAKRFPAVKLTL